MGGCVAAYTLLLLHRLIPSLSAACVYYVCVCMFVSVWWSSESMCVYAGRGSDVYRDTKCGREQLDTQLYHAYSRRLEAQGTCVGVCAPLKQIRA
jgi:hypothetical protein